MRMFAFAKRNIKEILRDPLNLAFGIGFPIVVLVLLSAIQKNIPVELFEISHLVPGITIFGLTFMTLFSATLISKDRSSSFLQRLYTTRIKAHEFILGYTLPIIPISLLQAIICYVVAVVFGYKITINTLYALLFIIPISVLFIALGLLCGSVFNEKQVGGICGALLTNLCAFLSGVWFDLNLVGGVFKRIAQALPFYHAVELERAVVKGNFSEITLHLLIVIAFAVVILILAVFLFLKQMKKQ